MLRVQQKNYAGNRPTVLNGKSRGSLPRQLCLGHNRAGGFMHRQIARGKLTGLLSAAIGLDLRGQHGSKLHANLNANRTASIHHANSVYSSGDDLVKKDVYANMASGMRGCS